MWSIFNRPILTDNNIQFQDNLEDNANNFVDTNQPYQELIDKDALVNKLDLCKIKLKLSIEQRYRTEF